MARLRQSQKIAVVKPLSFGCNLFTIFYSSFTADFYIFQTTFEPISLMAELELFQLLKQEVLLTYQKQYPYFQGNWKSFSSQDIQNLIEGIEEKTKQSISEKWIYTHLKPETNSKLPRKDMLDILSQFSGFSGWDEFVFKNKEVAIEPKEVLPKKNNKKAFIIFGILALIVLVAFIIYSNKKTTQKFQLKNEFTQETIRAKDVKAYKIEDNKKVQIPIQNAEVEVEVEDENTKIIIESPYYKKQEVKAAKTSGKTEILMKPDDYAMMLKAFMKSDIKDWETRKVQLDKILSDNLEVLVMLKENLGAEYFNKKEFSEKLIIPTASVKMMEILEIKKDQNGQIEFIRIKQE